MKRFLRKLRHTGGETLTETLAAVLVVSCASVLLATMILASSHLNATARAQDGVLYREVSAAEAQSEGGAPAKVVLTDEKNNRYSLNVAVYGKGDGLRSYRKEARP